MASQARIRPGEVAHLVNHELLVATSHPTRVKALSILKERDASAREIGQEIGQTSKHVKYHLDQLEKVDLVELIEKRPAYGGRVKEKIYRIKDRPYMDQEQWRAASEKDQIAITVQALELVSDDLAEALLGNTINWPVGKDADEFDPNHISRTTFALDKRGWNQLISVLNQTLSQAITINEQAAERAVESEEELIRGRLAILQFRAPLR